MSAMGRTLSLAARHVWVQRSLVKKRTVAVLAGLAACTGVGTWLWDRYQFDVVWPTRVQRELFGDSLVSSVDLIGHERHFAYGQGFARWKYKVAKGSPSLARLCHSAPPVKCSLRAHRTVERDVDLFGNLSGGVLTIEEWWT
jgi:hypothetical protein